MWILSTAIDYLMSQNFQINYDKSQLQCTDLLGYTLKNHTLSIPDQKWKRIDELLHSNNLQLIQRAAQTLAYYKHTLNSNQQLTIQKLLTNKVKDSEILSIYSKALSSKPQMTFTTSAGEPLKLYLDTSNQAAGLVLKQANNTLLSASIPLPAIHNYANTNEAQGAYMLIKRYLSQIKDYVHTARSELHIFSDNMLLAKALAGLSKITLGSETQYYARKIKILIATIKDTRTTYNYIQGKLNPADKPSRRTHKTQDTKWKATRQSNKHLAAKIFAHGTRSNYTYRTHDLLRTQLRPQLTSADLDRTQDRTQIAHTDHDLDLAEIQENPRKRLIISETTADTEPSQISQSDQKRRRLPT